MNLIIKSQSDLAQFFERDPAPYFGTRDTWSEQRPVPQRVFHSSEIPLDALFAIPSAEAEEAEFFDLDNFLNHH